MTKRVPSRNARSKGIKSKHVLQICLLLGISFWLIYQVKHSHDKKKELNESDARISTSSQSGDEMLKIGRKDLHPRVPEFVKNEKHEEDEEEDNEEQEEINKKEKLRHDQDQEEDEEEEIVHEEGSKHEEEYKKDDAIKEDDKKNEEEEQEEETKDEETEDEGGEGGDDGIDKHDQEKMEGDADGEEDFIEEETEREENSEEKKTENNEGKDKGLQVDPDPSLEDRDHENNAHEAREEHYKADDASSAVAHDASKTSTEPEKLGADTSNENSGRSDLEQNNKSVNISKAQEEHYKADDASSAVTRDIAANSSELEGASSEKSNENLSTDDSIQENELDGNNAKDVKGDQTNPTSQSKQGVTAEYVPSGENKDGDLNLHNPHPQNKSPEVASASNNQQQTSNKLVEVTGGDNSKDGSTGASGSSQRSETLNKISKSIETQNGTVDGATTEEVASQKTIELEPSNDNTVSNSSQLQNNLVVDDKTGHIEANGGIPSNSSSNLDSSDKKIKPDVAADADINSESSIQINKVTHAAIELKSGSDNESAEKDKTPGSSTYNVIGTADAHEHVDSSIDEDGNDNRIDLDTLPNHSIEGINSRDDASE
ncbi:hypothetical protein K2173_009185 [Erythroxylum novogranatense]|uniref:Uncharacterized protein n=1 Tax=Erythroxylum novogranatense TaxID=1862640 RepID=A0AAV8TEY4_9ROSI|nr:hypothetical protein K2173_009185 [Erythroxylum novogranatense]